MHNDRKLKLRIFSFLLVCTLMLAPLEWLTASAVPVSNATSAQAVQTHRDATVLTPTEQDPTPGAAACSSTPGYIKRNLLDPSVMETVVSHSTDWVTILLQQQQVLDILEANLGTPYVYGGSYPGGFDCSGIVYYIYYRQLGYNISRCADTQFLYDGVSVSQDELQLGDLVFFRDPSSPWAASHVGIYVGDRMMIHASCSRGLTYNSLDDYYYSTCYVGAKRILQTDCNALSNLDLTQFVTE